MESSRITTPNGIIWYIEHFHPTTIPKAAEPIILIPSGEGDCGNLQRLGLLLAEAGYHALSLDIPGFSRSEAPANLIEYISPQKLSGWIIGLLDHLGIGKAVFFGNSSGGGAVLTIACLYPERMKAGIVHEVPLQPTPSLEEVARYVDDEAVAKWCEDFFANHFIEQTENDGRAKWDALGPAYHGRLRRNYVK